MITGPDFIGCTTLLQELQRVGYNCNFLRDKPEVGARAEFSKTHFQQQVQHWTEISNAGEAVIIEDSPWAYFQRHIQHLPADVRSNCQSELARLTLPHLTLVLHTSGVTVGRRHPTARGKPEEYSSLALQQMQALQHI